MFKKFLMFLFFNILLFANTQKPHKIKVQLLWKHQFEFAGFYIAKEKGFYKNLGLDVELLEYKNGINVAKDVSLRKVDFGVVYSDIILEELNDIVVLSAILQLSPHILVSLESSDIKSIKDFKNRKIMISEDAKNSAAFMAMLRSNGLTLKDMIVFEPTYDINSLIDKKVDITTAYLSNEIYFLDKKGIKYKIWDPKDFGFDLYSDIIITSRYMVEKNPDIVEKFIEATLKGYEYAFSHISESVELVYKKYNSLHKSKDALIYEANVLKKLAYFNGKKLGEIDRNKIQRIIDIYRILGLLKQKVDIDRLLYNFPKNRSLNKKEFDYLKKNIIDICIYSDIYPLEKIEKDKYIGIVADFIRYFENFLDVKFNKLYFKNFEDYKKNIKEKRCDIIPYSKNIDIEDKMLNFTSPYFTTPIIVITKVDIPYIESFNRLKDKRLAIIKSGLIDNFLKKRDFKIDIVYVKDIKEGLELVRKDKAYGYIDLLPNVGYILSKKYIGELKISGEYDIPYYFKIGVRKDNQNLYKIFQKAVNSIDKNIKQEILNRWLYVRYEKGVDYSLIFKIVGFFLIISIISLFIFLKMYRLNKKISAQKNELKILATTDSLTNLYNRRYFTEIAKNSFSLSKREKKSLSIIMMDIDDFKKINDNYGHQIGDVALKELSKVIKESIRDSDIACRYGGEEFIILLPDTSKSGAYIVAKKIRDKIKNIHIDERFYFTVSIGVSSIDFKKDKSIEDIIKRADEAMYKVKKSGKDNISLN